MFYRCGKVRMSLLKLLIAGFIYATGIVLCSCMGNVSDKEIEFPPAPEINYVQAFGHLQVADGRLRDKSGNVVQLKGMSTYWLNWPSGEKFAKADVVSTLAKEWGISVLRIAMGVNPGDGSGYLPGGNRDELRDMVYLLADACIDNGIYFIVDWHSYNTLHLADLETEFFSEIAAIYGDCPNLMYELYNEPGQFESWPDELKPYQENLVLNVIRPIDPDNVIIIGSRAWDQHPEECADNPIVADNIAYSIHFYAAGHCGVEAADMRARYDYAMSKGLALFATEWGPGHWDWTKEIINKKEANLWSDWMDANGVGWTNWSICDLNETSSALIPGTSPTDAWTSRDLSASGIYIRWKLLE